MPKPTLHLIAPYYSTLTSEWLHDGHTDRVFRFSRMMQALGYRIVEYSAGRSASAAETKVSLMSESEHAKFFPQMGPKQTRPCDSPNTPGFKVFDFRLTGEICSKAEAGDIICHTYGNGHSALIGLLTACHHVETGIGYSSNGFGAWRIFDSEAWRHYHWGRDSIRSPAKDSGSNRNYSWVIPNPHDPEDWPVGAGEGDTVVYFGRMDPDKGMNTLSEIIREHAKMVNDGLTKPLHFAFAGRGDFDQVIDRPIKRAPNPLHKDNGVKVTYMGPLSQPDAARFLARARCLLAPTEYVEPLGNTAIQGMFAGTPALTSDHGGYTETVLHGVDGFRCKTIGDWLCAIEASRWLNRRRISERAAERFSTEVCGKMYDEAFQQIADLSGLGWYSRHSWRIAVPKSDLGPHRSEPSLPVDSGGMPPALAPAELPAPPEG
jgi:glycosyltransferase involved in cell wall biosynthesis